MTSTRPFILQEDGALQRCYYAIMDASSAVDRNIYHCLIMQELFVNSNMSERDGGGERENERERRDISDYTGDIPLRISGAVHKSGAGQGRLAAGREAGWLQGGRQAGCRGWVNGQELSATEQKTGLCVESRSEPQ